MIEERLKTGNIVEVKLVKQLFHLPDASDATPILSKALQTYTAFKNQNGVFITGLTPEEETYFEKELQLRKGDLNRYNGAFWADNNFKFRIGKGGVILDINNPKDHLTYRWLLAQDFVATSPQDLEMKPWAKIKITSIEEESKVKNVKNKVLKDAIVAASKFSYTDMVGYLMIRGNTNVSDSSNREFVQSQFDEAVLANPELFLQVTNNPEEYKTLLFLKKCAQKRILTPVENGYKVTGTTRLLGQTISECTRYLLDPVNAELKYELEIKLDAALGKIKQPETKSEKK